jgi:hypothetical protein
LVNIILTNTASFCRNARLKGSLEEDGWEVQLIADKWVCFQSGSLNLLAYTGTEDVFGEGGILDQIGMEAGYKNYATGTLKADFKGALSIGVKQGYADLFDSETGGVSTVSNLMRDADEDESFIFTGHSKGGVFAQIAGITALGTDARQRASVIAYGVPPIFSSDGASVVNEMSHAFLRVSKENDIVVNYADSGSKGYNGGAVYQIPLLSTDIVVELVDPDNPSGPTIRDGLGTQYKAHDMGGYLRSIHNIELDEIRY